MGLFALNHTKCFSTIPYKTSHTFVPQKKILKLITFWFSKSIPKWISKVKNCPNNPKSPQNWVCCH